VLGRHQPGKHADEAPVEASSCFASRLELAFDPTPKLPKDGNPNSNAMANLAMFNRRSRIPLRPA